MARVPFVTTDELPDDERHLLSSFGPKAPDDHPELLSEDERNVYRTLAHAPSTLEAFRNFGGTVREELGFAPRERELVVMSAARALESAYEWHQHVRIGLAEGLSRDEIVAIADGEYDPFDEDERALLAYVSAFVTGSVDDETYERFAETADERTIVGVGLLAGVYVVIARQMDALEVETEEPFVGWRLENL